jgi:hypothetical protein
MVGGPPPIPEHAASAQATAAKANKGFMAA